MVLPLRSVYSHRGHVSRSSVFFAAEDREYGRMPSVVMSVLCVALGKGSQYFYLWLRRVHGRCVETGDCDFAGATVFV